MTTGGEAPREDADVETSSEDYARRFAGEVGAFFLEVQAGTTLSLLAPWPRASVLDVGGGHGQLTGPLVEAGHQVTVFGSAEVCRRRISSFVDAGRARFQSGDLSQLPFPERAFDVVVSYRLLPHARRFETLLAELARVARHAVIVDYPTRRSFNALAAATFGAKKRVEGDTRPFRVFRDAEVERVLAARGFRVSGRRPQFLLPMALHRALGLASVSRALEGTAAGLGLTGLLGSPVILRAERPDA